MEKTEIRDIQAEVNQWAEKKFGAYAQRPKYPAKAFLLLRSFASLGKACHHFLKRQQGIRKNEDHDAEIGAWMDRTILDAARFKDRESRVSEGTEGQLLNLPASTAPLLGMVEELAETTEKFLLRNIFSDEEKRREITAEIEDGLGDLMIYLLNFCGMEGINASEALAKTWDHVLERSTGKGGGHFVPEEKVEA